ncbi:UDP-N-acetylglucosamine/UDP-glucose/GDP-mannose transporter-like [Sinocyclocheilus grahami]|uniref:UDP-N-acetylglucosamine/UDP-glucose/GDP-mannose transporter-like n=1 Tax=Sinocyclocheilus grahami TaxID=75366 RepID=UPI0007ACFF52|nr:PREDICTED: UDP-N-acetylglucosamine/UDP-glucose/GDP-mannose transporter-like [Sinocyclocheilus grahami]
MMLKDEVNRARLMKFASAVFYAFCSFFIIVVNKSILTEHKFPSFMFLGIGQMTATIIILYVAKMNKAIHFQDFDKSIPGKIFPLPLLYVGNHVTGLGGTQKLSLPMFTVLRKFTILLTMLMESRILRPDCFSSDLSFNAEGYTFVLLNDVFTAASGVYTKKKLGMEGLGKYGVLFYNAFIIIIPTVLASAYTGDLEKALTFEGWMSVTFVFYFLLSCVMGFILMYSIILCSYYNTALTTTVVGAIKNIAVMYIGMFIGGDYIFSWTNFIGLNICISAALIYSYITFHSSGSSETNVKPAEDKLSIHITENHLEKT